MQAEGKSTRGRFGGEPEGQQRKQNAHHFSQGSMLSPGLPRLEEESSRESSSSADTTSVFTATPLESDISPETTTLSLLNLGVSSSPSSLEKSKGSVSLRSQSFLSLLKADRTLLKSLPPDIFANTEQPGSTESLHMEVEEMEDEGPPHIEAPVENVFVDKKAVDKLTEGLLSHYLPDLQNSKRALQELTQNQVILLDTLDQEVTKFRDCNALLDLNSLFTEAKVYHNKLVNIRKEMIMLHEKTTKLKKRALKLQQQKQNEALEKEQQREKELERERRLVAKPAKRS
ncbi:hypothetical protein F7725_026550 [Dissostichus mawsoni]|uniref:BLOC-1 subunit 6 n=1 Tax=Dissostichus mawsoni TaxID=36200 RepID=A0A7J5X7D5_DISMA|nr:hypothetical protein F7725_026550 [Dissostichus mawsoni]